MARTLPPKLGRYEILEEIGKGAMGVVYLARDPLIGRHVALKTFHIGYSVKDQELQQFRKRFIREAQSAGILSHPSIVTIHDVVEESAEGVTFIAMEYVRGTNLKELLQRSDALPVDFALEVVAQVADALEYAHSKGVVHRDVKPANIIITPDQKVKITDFGIARLDTSNLTVEGQLLGTPNYMAPEQIQGKDVDHRADLFSLGVVLYELLTRQKPFQGENLTVVTHRIVYDSFTPPEEFVGELPQGLRAILVKALEKDPAARYQRAGEVGEALREILAAQEALNDTLSTDEITRPVAMAPATAGEGSATLVLQRLRELADRVRLPLRQRPGKRVSWPRLAVAGTLAALATLGLGLGLLWIAHPGEPQPVGLTPEERLERAALPLIREGRERLLGGDPAAAVALLARAQDLAPGIAAVPALRAEAERQARDQANAEETARQITAWMEEGAAALRAGKPEEAVAAAGKVLALEPEHAEALAMSRTAEERVARQRREVRASRPVRSAEPPPRETVPAAPAPAPVEERADAAPPRPPATAPARLRVEFFSQLPEGTLTVYAGERQILREAFRYVRRKGFLRTEPTTGGFEITREVEPGATTLKVYLALPGRETELVTLEEMLAAGAPRTLDVDVSAEGRLSAHFR
jgi:tRNA A-37 threonylcarbamoyl transferase component Bud32/tetratricopeptide (TPR) repeat protein